MPPPSGKTMVYRPSGPVVLVRVIPVSTDVASTRAPATAWLSRPATRPINMSVVDPTCAKTGAGRSNAISVNTALNELGFISPQLVPSSFLRVAAGECCDCALQNASRPGSSQGILFGATLAWSEPLTTLLRSAQSRVSSSRSLWKAPTRISCLSHQRSLTASRLPLVRSGDSGRLEMLSPSAHGVNYRA